MTDNIRKVMRYKFVAAIVLSGVILGFLSCSKSKDALVQKPLVENIRGISSLDKVEFHQCESSVKLSFSSDVEWRVDNVPDWIDIKGISNRQGGIGTTVITIIVPTNLTGSERTADLHFVERGGDGQLLNSLKISQPAVVFALNLPASASDNNLAYNWFEYKDGTNGGPRTIGVKSNIFWEIEESYQGDASAFYTFSQMVGENNHDVNIIPTKPNFDGDFEVLVKIIPFMKPEDGSPLKQIEGLDPLTFTMSQSHLRFIADWSDGTVLKTANYDSSMPVTSIFGPKAVNKTALFSELGPKAPGEHAFDYTTTAQTEATFKVSSVTPWIVTKCPEWLELSVGGQKLSVLDRDHLVPAGEETIVTVKILGANPFLNTERLDDIEIAPHHVDAISPDNSYIVTKDIAAAQAPFIFEVKREDSNPVLDFNFKNDFPGDVYDNDSYADDESYSILLTTSGTYEDCELLGVPEWLKYATPVLVDSESNNSTWRYTFSLAAQNLAFSFIDADLTLRQKESLTQAGEVLPEVTSNFRASQDAFTFDVSMQASQTIGGVLYEISDLPPALTIAKQLAAGKDLFSFDASKMSGEWELGPDTSDWLKVYAEAQPGDITGSAITGGKKGGNFKFYFGPESANQNAVDTPRSGKLQVASVRHREKYGSWDNIPSAAKKEWTVTQRKFRYALSATGTSQPAYSNNFADRVVTLNVKCDGQWEIRENEIPEFLTHKSGPLSADGAEGNYTVTFSVKPNPTTAAKSDNIKVYCIDRNNEMQTVTVNQEAFVFQLASGQPSSFTGIPAYVQPGTNYSVNLNVTEGAAISIVDNTSGKWIGTLSSSAAIGVGKNAISTLQFHPLTHTDLSSGRSGNVTVSITEPAGVSSPITVSFAQNKYLFSISETEDFSFTELNSRTSTMHVTSSGPWSLSTDKNWLSVSQASGVGSENSVTITVQAAENVDTSDRSGVITFAATDGAFSNAPVATKNALQDAYKWEVTSDDQSFDYTFEPLELTEKTIKVKSSGPWSLSNVPNWVKVSAPSYNGDESGAWTLVKLESTKNLSTAASARAKTGFNIVANKNTSLSGAVYVTQKPFIWEVTGEKDMAWTSPLSKVSKSVSVKSSGAWKIVMGNKSLPAPGKLGEHWTWSWSEQSGGSKADAVSVSPDVNNSFEDASASFDIVSIEHESQGGSLKETISCFQPKYVMEFNTSSIIFEPWNKLNEALNQTTSVPVTCTTGNWTLEESSDWINVSKTSGNAIVTVDNYNGSSSRNATVTLKSTDTDITLTRTLNVSQDPYVFKVHNSSDSEQTVHTKGVEAKQVPIDCSASFQIDDLPDFVQANITNGQLVFSVSKNTNATQRVGEIKLTSHGLTIPVKLTQMPYLFSIEGLTNQGTGVLPPSADGKLSFKVHSNVSWSMTMPSSWAKLVSGSTYGNPENKASATTYDIVIGPTDSNNSSVAHTGSLSFANDIYGSSAAPFICNLRQDGFTTGTVTLPDFDAYSASTLSQTSQFASSVDWSANVTSGGNWLSVSPDAGVGGTSPTLTITASNNTGSARSGAIVISGIGDAGTYTRTINVNQKAFVWSVSATSHNFVAWNPADFEFSVTSPASSTISASENWVHLSTENIGAGTNVVTVSVDGNTGNARQATITVTTAGVNTKTISINQEAFMFSASPVNVQVNAYSPAAVKISITSSGDVNVASDAAWLTAGAALVPAGVQKGLWLTADSNYAGEQRVGHVTLTTVAGNTIVTVTQSAFEWSVSPSSGGFAAYNPSVQYLTVTSSAPVTLSSTEDWIHFPSNLDAGKEVLATVTADNNTASTSRTAYITLSTAEHSKQVPFTQAAFQWSVTGGDSHNFVATNAPAFTFNVTSSAECTLSVSPADAKGWLSFPASVAAGSGKAVTVSAADNTSTASRSAVLTIASHGHSKTFNLTQAGLPDPPAE